MMQTCDTTQKREIINWIKSSFINMLREKMYLRWLFNKVIGKYAHIFMIADEFTNVDGHFRAGSAKCRRRSKNWTARIILCSCWGVFFIQCGWGGCMNVTPREINMPKCYIFGENVERCWRVVSVLSSRKIETDIEILFCYIIFQVGAFDCSQHLSIKRGMKRKA